MQGRGPCLFLSFTSKVFPRSSWAACSCLRVGTKTQEIVCTGRHVSFEFRGWAVCRGTFDLGCLRICSRGWSVSLEKIFTAACLGNKGVLARAYEDRDQGPRIQRSVGLTPSLQYGFLARHYAHLTSPLYPPPNNPAGFRRGDVWGDRRMGPVGARHVRNLAAPQTFFSLFPYFLSPSSLPVHRYHFPAFQRFSDTDLGGFLLFDVTGWGTASSGPLSHLSLSVLQFPKSDGCVRSICLPYPELTWSPGPHRHSESTVIF